MLGQPKGPELLKILRWLQDKVPRSGWDAAKRKRARSPPLSRTPAGKPPHPMAQPAGRRSPAFFPGGQPVLLAFLQGLSELLGCPVNQVLHPFKVLKVVVGGIVKDEGRHRAIVSPGRE